MMRRPSDYDLGELNYNCSALLFQNLADGGIDPIWVDTKNRPRGGALFFLYDGQSTCLRVLPRAPKFCHAALRGNRLSQADATTLSRELVRTARNIRDKYSGFFSSELNNGLVGQILKNTVQPGQYDFLEAHTSLAPDELYAGLPWPFIPDAHIPGQFASAGVRNQYFAHAIQEPLRALTLAVEVAAFGTCTDLTVDRALVVLDWLNEKFLHEKTAGLPIQSDPELRKIIIPCLAGGFQGLVFAFFYNLPPNLEAFVFTQLYHFASTIGEGVAAYRERLFSQASDNATNLMDYLRALTAIFPPSEHIICEAGKERAGLRLHREGSYLAGYRSIQGKDLEEAFDDIGSELLIGQNNLGVRVLAKLSTDIPALVPQFTLLRLKPILSQVSHPLPQTTQILARTELGVLRHQLRGYVQQERGALAAARRLFAVDAILRHYEQGDVVLSNAKARAFIREALGKETSGYHVAGKAAAKFIADMQKMLPNRLNFEGASAHGIKIRWIPEVTSQLKTEFSVA